MTWEIVMAHPGCEQTALAGPFRFPTREAAQVALDHDAAQWICDGYLLTVLPDDSYLISPRDTPTQTTHLLVRESTTEWQPPRRARRKSNARPAAGTRQPEPSGSPADHEGGA